MNHRSGSILKRDKENSARATASASSKEFLDHVASFIVNANHGIVRPAVKFCVTNCMVGRIGLGVPQPTKWQRIGNQIDNRDDLRAVLLRKGVVKY
jgi:hypothetical protein